MELSVLDRLKLLEALPPQGDIGTLKIIRQLKEKLSFTEEEIQDMEISFKASEEVKDGVAHPVIEYNWNREKAKILIVEFKPTALNILAVALKKLNREGKLTEQYVSIYEKFFGEVKPEDAF